MSEHNVIAIDFADRGNAYQALSELKGADLEGRLELRAAAVVERTADGLLRFTEGVDNDGGSATAGGGLLGMLVGVIGGPIGMLLGWSTGLLVGSVVDVNRADRGAGALSAISAAVPAGGTAVVAEVTEHATEVVDGLAAQLGGTVLRRSADLVLAEIEAAEDAYRQAEKLARQQAREQRRGERKESFEQRVDALKEKLGIGG
jgi:uncharacterized membrane protein